MSDVEGAGTPVSVGQLLRDSAVVVLRHWVVLVVGTLVLVEACLLNLSILGHCFGAYMPSCPSFVTTIDGAEWLVKSLLMESAGFLVAATSIYFLYSSAKIDVPSAPALRRSTARTLRLLARLATLWIVILLPMYAVDTAIWKAWEALQDFEISPVVQWLLFFARTIAIMVFAAYMGARLVLYVPAAAYSHAPEGWRSCWKRTRKDAIRLFAVFLTIRFVASVTQIALVMLAYRTPVYVDAVGVVSDFLGIRSSYVLHNLADVSVYALMNAPGTLMEAAASLVAFKVLVSPADRATADIFS